MMLRVLFLLTLAFTAVAVEPPHWVLAGLLQVETKSYYRPSGNIAYVVRSVGKAGERGPFQMGEAAFDVVAKKGEQFRYLQTSTQFAEKMAVRYLEWIYDHEGKHDWMRTVAVWNGGSHWNSFAAQRFAREVEAAGKAAP